MIRIVTDSTASIPADLALEENIEVVTLYVNYKGVEYEDATMDIDAFYEDIQEMVDDIPTSSQPSQARLEYVFENAAEAGDEVLGIFMSSKMSGTVEGALQAARSVRGRYDDFTCQIIDSTSNSFDEAWPVLAAVAARSAGSTLEQCAAFAEESVRSTRFLFAPESLKFLKAGGRIGNAAAMLGTLMKLSPVITVKNGESSTFAKVRTQKKAIEKISDKFKSDISEYGLKNAIVHYIGSPAPAREWARDVIEPLCGRKVAVLPVSPCIGLHVGPAVGIAYECERPIPGKLDASYPPIVYAV